MAVKVNVPATTINPSGARVATAKYAGSVSFSGCTIGKHYAISRAVYGNSSDCNIVGATVNLKYNSGNLPEVHPYWTYTQIRIVTATSSTIQVNRPTPQSNHDSVEQCWVSIVQLD